MIPISKRQGMILDVLRGTDGLSVTGINEQIQNVSPITLKRDLSVLTKAGFVVSTGKGRLAGYITTPKGRFATPVVAATYSAREPDTRSAYTRYDESVIPQMNQLFLEDEYVALEAATEQFRTRATSLSETLAHKELERFVIELSWKSSRIEGNTYTLLDTERLIRDGVEAEGHTQEEATMILNHKRAFDFIHANTQLFEGEPSRATIEEVHRLLTEDLEISQGVRRGLVGIVGTAYRPLDNKFQIEEAMTALRTTIGVADTPYTAALTALLGISYIQPFEDGNKRTARLLANALLMARGCAPLSYRSTDEVLYREATLVFYETHSIIPFKELFISQYLFAADQYGLVL